MRDPIMSTGGRARALDLARNVVFCASLWVAYALVRGLTADDHDVALANASSLLRVQDALGVPSELGFQQLVLDATWLVQAANRYYLYVHFPVTVAFLAWCWARRPHTFVLVRNSLALVTAAGLVLHVLYPLAPPRMMPGFVDTGATVGPSPYDVAGSSSANQIAAMPSLHVGWALLLAIAVISQGRGRWRWLAALHPLVTTAVVVVTANHYWADAAVAAVLVVAAWAAVVEVSAAGRAGRRHDRAVDHVEALGQLADPVADQGRFVGGRLALERRVRLDGQLEGRALALARQRARVVDGVEPLLDLRHRRLDHELDRVGV